jgi:zinc transport system substrate-binding protein
MPQYTRRRFVTVGIGFTTIGSLAGCSLNDAACTNSGGGGPEARALFFVFGDFVRQVAGDTATAEALVPIGQHGHGGRTRSPDPENGPQIGSLRLRDAGIPAVG